MELSPLQEKIIEAFVKITKDKPADEVTVTRICSEAGISRTTFYTQFENLDALVELIQYGTIHDLRQILRDVEYVDLAMVKKSGEPIPMLTRAYKYMKDHWDTLQWLDGPNGSGWFEISYREQTRDFFARITKGRFEEPTASAVQSLCYGLTERLTLDWIAGDFEATADEMGAYSTRAIFAVFDEFGGW